MAPDDIINEVEEEEEEETTNIINLNNYGMKPYEDPDKNTNYVFDGTSIVQARGSIVTMIGDEDELTDLAAAVGPGTIAYKAGWLEAWQLDVDGSTWVQFIGGDE